MSRVEGLCVTYRQVLDWMIGFIDTLYIHSELQAITALSLIYTLYKSLGQAMSLYIFTYLVLKLALSWYHPF
jgi:hypothetical protein